MKQIFIAFTVIVITACAPTTQFPDVNKDLAAREAEIQRDIALQETYKYFSRLQDVAAPVFLANADICPDNKVNPFYGFHAESVEAFDEKFQGAAGRIYGLQQNPTVFHVSAKTPAFGKFQKGDVITQVNDQKIPSGKRGSKKLNDYLFEKGRLKEETIFIIERQGTPYTLKVRPQPACGGKAILSDEPIVNAFADGENIIFTRQMMQMAEKDNELALIIGHEIAHNSRKHIESKQGNALIGMVLGTAVSVATGVNVMGLGSDLGGMAYSQSFEAEADYVGLYHTARAGYNIDNAPNFWRRMAATNPASIDMIGSSHPSSSARFIALEETVKEIRAKKASGLVLIPEEKEVEKVKSKPEYN